MGKSLLVQTDPRDALQHDDRTVHNTRRIDAQCDILATVELNRQQLQRSTRRGKFWFLSPQLAQSSRRNCPQFWSYPNFRKTTV